MKIPFSFRSAISCRRFLFGVPRTWVVLAGWLLSALSASAHDPLASWALLQARGERLEFRVEMGSESAWLFLGESPDTPPDIDHSVPRLKAHAAELYRLTAGGKELALLEANVEQREEDGVVFRLKYARPAGSEPVRFEATLMKRMPEGHHTTLTLLDAAEKVFRAEILTAAKPTVELPLPPAAMVPAPAPAKP